MNWSIARRLWLMVGASVVALLVVATSGSLQGRAYESSLEYFEASTLPSIGVIGEIERSFFLLRINAYVHILNTDEARMAAQETVIATQQAHVAKGLDDYEKLVSDEQDKRLLATDRRVLSD